MPTSTYANESYSPSRLKSDRLLGARDGKGRPVDLEAIVKAMRKLKQGKRETGTAGVK
jgi:hypothetical protein